MTGCQFPFLRCVCDDPPNAGPYRTPAPVPIYPLAVEPDPFPMVASDFVVPRAMWISIILNLASIYSSRFRDG